AARAIRPAPTSTSASRVRCCSRPGPSRSACATASRDDPELTAAPRDDAGGGRFFEGRNASMRVTVMDRRHFLMSSAVAGIGAMGLAGCGGAAGGAPRGVGPALDPELEELQARTFRWFVDTTNRSNGMTPDRWPKKTFASIAAIGYALTCWPIGVERGWMTREEARERTLITVRFFHDAPQGPEPTGVAGYKGFFYHFLNMETGLRHADTELSTVDTTLLLGGMLYAAQWFDGDHPDEVEIRRLVQAIYERVDWNFAVVRPNRISMGWRPERGFVRADWNVYNEGMLVL